MRRRLYEHVRIGRGALLFLVVAGAWILFSGEAKQPEWRAASQAALRRPTGLPQLVSIEPFSAEDGVMCEWQPASAGSVLRASVLRQAQMARTAVTSDNAERPVLKVKLGADDAAHDAQRLLGVRAGAPAAQIIVDANEGWNIRTLEAMLATADECGVALIEQPLPVGADAALLRLDSPVPIGADESVHTAADLDQLREKYDVVNVKLDKTGGLTHALKMIECAKVLDFEIMVGCMVATSLSMAPAMLLAPLAKFVDLDGPLLLRDDRHGGLVYENSTIRWSANRFWGEP